MFSELRHSSKSPSAGDDSLATALLIRSPIIALSFVFVMIAMRYLFDTVNAAAAAGIVFTSAGGMTVARVGFAAFPLGFAVYFVTSLFSPRRILAALRTELTLLGIVIAVRLLGMAAAHSLETARLLLPEVVISVLCIVAIRAERHRQRLAIPEEAERVASWSHSERASLFSFWSARILTGVIALVFLASGAAKLAHVPKVVGGLLHAGIPESAVIPIGILEIALVLLYVFPKTSVLGAFLLTGFVGGAVVTHIIAKESFAAPLFIGTLMFVSVYLRQPQLRKLVPLRGNSRSSADFADRVISAST
jgi:hypothetical protein